MYCLSTSWVSNEEQQRIESWDPIRRNKAETRKEVGSLVLKESQKVLGSQKDRWDVDF
jgi:hypothetical protein